MAPPISTYQTENFDPPPDEELICSICRCVFYDPVECPCRHVYCRTCISSWLNRHKTCPVCRKRASLTTLQTVVPIIKNMIMKLTINCPNVERGCKQKMPLEAKGSHLMNCEYEMIQCRNTNCKEKFVRKDINRHEQKECKCRKVRCRRKCMLMLPVNMIKTHSCVEELKKELKEKKTLIEDLKKEVEQYKAELKKAKSELQQALTQNRDFDVSDDFGSLHSESSLSPSQSIVDFVDSDSSLSNFSNTNSLNSDENDISSEVEEPEMRSFIDLVLMTLFPSPDGTLEHYTQQGSVAADSQNSPNIDIREVNSQTSSVREINESERSLSIVPNGCEQFNLVRTNETVENNLVTEATTSSNVNIPNNSCIRFTAPEVLQEHKWENAEVSSGERIPVEENGSLDDSSDETTLALRSRMLKRKSSLPVLSDSSESEPQRIRRRRWGARRFQEFPIDTHTNIEESTTTVSISKTEIDRESTSVLHETRNLDNSSSDKSPNACTATGNGNRSVNSNTFRGNHSKPRDSQIPISRIPVPVSFRGEGEILQSNQNSCDTQETNAAQTLQLLHCDLGDEVQSRVATNVINLQAEPDRNHRQLQPVFGLPESRTQRALQLLKTYATQSCIETRANSSELNEMSTLELLNRLAEESDPDWEPPDNGEETDDTISDTIDSDSSYEVQIPERTWDMLERYSQEPSDDDGDWIPSGRRQCNRLNNNV